MASGGVKGHVPWGRLQHAQSDYILDKYLPSGITLTQYHHIRARDVNALLQHWMARQAAGEIPFRFKKVVDTSSQQRQHPGANGDNPADVKNGMEDNSDGTRNSQEQGSNEEFPGDGEELFPGDGEELHAEPPAESGSIGSIRVSLVTLVMADVDLLFKSAVDRVSRNMQSRRQKRMPEKIPPLSASVHLGLASFAVSTPQNIFLYLLT
jgi:hypothetical protein